MTFLLPLQVGVTMAGVLAIANGGTNSTAAATLGVGYGTGSAHAYTPVGIAKYYNPQLEQPLFGRR
jgi:hypothetical protein